jgi:hypothetical protein
MVHRSGKLAERCPVPPLAQSALRDPMRRVSAESFPPAHTWAASISAMSCSFWDIFAGPETSLAAGERARFEPDETFQHVQYRDTTQRSQCSPSQLGQQALQLFY